MTNCCADAAEIADVEVTGVGYAPRKVTYSRDVYGFLKQDNPRRFNYENATYQNKQSTNSEMVKLRLGWLGLHLKEDFSKMTAVDVGSGSGIFVKEAQPYFKRLVPYNLTGDSISEKDLYSTNWGIVFLFDVLEHYDNVDLFWNLNFKYAYISYPEYHNTPLNTWRHGKIDEHVYNMDILSMRRFVAGKAEIIAEGCPEDLIRTRWDKDLNNITSVLLKKS